MNLPNTNDARKRTDKKTEYIYLDKDYDKNIFNGKKYYLKTYIGKYYKNVPKNSSKT